LKIIVLTARAGGLGGSTCTQGIGGLEEESFYPLLDCFLYPPEKFNGGNLIGWFFTFEEWLGV